MKKYLKLSLFLFTIIGFTSCDYIDQPIQGGGINPGDTAKVYRNILIDDFTGHKCVNCPEAAEMIETMEGLTIFKDRIVSVAVHTGFFANAFAAPFDALYKTTDGEDLAGVFGPSNFPIGMVNRIDFPNDHLKSFQSWPDVANQFVGQETEIDIQPSANMTSDSTFNVSVDLEYRADLSNTDLNITVLITESGIISAQTSHSGDIADYEHKHMLRGTTNTIIGESIGINGKAVGDKETYSTTGTLPSSSVAANSHLVVYVYNTATQEIMQVEQIDLL
jgi:hypothetical protein